MTAEESLSNLKLKSLNFGPVEVSVSVREVAEIAKSYFPNLDIEFVETVASNAKESLFLNLDSSLSLKEINWQPTFSQDFALNLTFEWWKKLLDNDSTAQELCEAEIRLHLKADINN